MMQAFWKKSGHTGQLACNLGLHCRKFKSSRISHGEPFPLDLPKKGRRALGKKYRP